MGLEVALAKGSGSSRLTAEVAEDRPKPRSDTTTTAPVLAATTA